MTPNVRIFASEDGARRADTALAENGFSKRSLLLPSLHRGQEEAAVQAAIDEGTLPERYVRICVRSLKEGRALVAVEAPWGRAVNAINLMEREDTVHTEMLLRYVANNPAPLSDSLGLATLSRIAPSAGLLRSTWALSSMFGMGLLSRKAAPLSSLFGLPTLTKSKRDWRTSFGFPMLSNNPAPLSSRYGLPILTKPKRDWQFSFELPLLFRNPAPLSSLLGLKTLIKERKAK